MHLAAPPGRSGEHGPLTWKPLSMGSGAGLGWGAGWAQHGGKGAPLFDSGDHVDRREGEDAGGGGSGREGHGGGSSQRGARGHDSGAGQGGAGATGKVMGDTTGRQHQSEQLSWALAWAVVPHGLLTGASSSDLTGGCEGPGETSTEQGLGAGWELWGPGSALAFFVGWEVGILETLSQGWR